MILDFSTLDKAQLSLWRLLHKIPEEFVLYGGTAIALKLGHRKSIDFDFFSNEEFDTMRLFKSLDFLQNSEVMQNEKNTLTVSVKAGNTPVKVSFFGDLKLGKIKEPDIFDGIRIASMEDLFGTKCATITQRLESKDYLDIYAILSRTNHDLKDGIKFAKQVYGNAYSEITTLKSLIDFSSKEIVLDETIKMYLEKSVKEYTQFIKEQHEIEL